jgi:transposase
MLAYSKDLRERVLAAVDANEGTQEQIARRFRVTARWIRKLLDLRKSTGSIDPKPRSGGRKPRIGDAEADTLRAAVGEAPDATLDELVKATGFGCCIATIWRALERLKITRKKSRCGRRSSSIPRSKRSVRRGPSGWGKSTRSASCSSTRATRRRR